MTMMTKEEARAIMTAAIEAAAVEGKDTSGMEIAREYFTNPAFRAQLEQYVWDLNNKGALKS